MYASDFLCIDEILYAARVRRAFLQYMKNKPAKCGIKFLIRDRYNGFAAKNFKHVSAEIIEQIKILIPGVIKFLRF